MFNVPAGRNLKNRLDKLIDTGIAFKRPTFLSKPEGDSDFYFVQADDPETAAPWIVDLVKTRIPQRFGFNPIRDIQVLCPMNRGGVGARSLNIELQAALNPAGDRKVERFGFLLTVSFLRAEYRKRRSGDGGCRTSDKCRCTAPWLCILPRLCQGVPPASIQSAPSTLRP